MDLNAMAQSTCKDAAKHRKFEAQEYVSTQIPTMTKQELSETIAIAYQANCVKPELIAIKDFARYGRKYGFPIICEIADQSEDEQLFWAAKLLISIANSWPEIDTLSCNEFELITGSLLHDDAVKFVSNALATTNRFTEK